jgi:carboxypeptidase C (cathepsin A)
MKKTLYLLSFCLGTSLFVQAQQKPAPKENAPLATTVEDKPNNGSRTLNPDSYVVTTNEVTIKGQKVPYKALAGTIPVWNDDAKIQASLFYTYYERTDVKDKATRPLIISFNGGRLRFGLDAHCVHRTSYFED